MNKLHFLATLWSNHLSIAIESLIFLAKTIDIKDERILNEYENYFLSVTENMERTIGYIENIIKLGFTNQNDTTLEHYIRIHTEELNIFNQRIKIIISKYNKSTICNGDKI